MKQASFTELRNNARHFFDLVESGEPVRILPGDLVSFHAGLDSQWEVVKPLRKHYSDDFPNGV